MEKAAQTPNGAPHRRRRRRPAGNGSAPQAQQPAREGKAPAQPRKPAPQAAAPAAPKAPRSTAPEQPGLDLISRRPPKQKFANFEDYLAAHGGMTVPLPPEASDAADTPETATPAEAAE